MGPRLLLLAAQLMGKSPGRGCNDYTLPADVTDADVVELCRLANKANLGGTPRERWNPDDIETPEKMRESTMDFVIFAALREGLREMADGRASAVRGGWESAEDFAHNRLCETGDIMARDAQIADRLEAMAGHTRARPIRDAVRAFIRDLRGNR